MSQDRIEIRMFGRLFVRRSNGDVVDPDEWSTGKTTDLLRILALNGNRPVSVQSLIAKLWPDVEEDKAKASLRTAASRVRHVLGEPCIERSLGGLVLRNSWNDVTAFRSIVHDIATSARNGDHAHVVELAREAEALYVADFHAYDDKASWAIETRDSIKMSRQTMLAEAGESALKLMWMRDALDLSTLAIAEDPCFERPHRTLMRAHAALGEVDLALRAFEHCRVCLSQELGADPSPQTRALHIQILSGDVGELSIKPFAGRADEVRRLATDLRTAMSGEGCEVVCVTGPPGSGRGALLEAATARVPHAALHYLLEGGTPTSDAEALAGLVSTRRSDITVWGPADGHSSWEAIRVLIFLAGLDPTIPRVIAVITSSEAADLLGSALLGGPTPMHRIDTGPVSDDDLEALASAALSGTVTPRLLCELAQQSERLAGRAVWVLRDWMASGWIISTSDGLDLYNDASALMGEPPVGDYFRLTMEQLSLGAREFCHFLSLIDRPATADLVHKLGRSTWTVEEVQAELDELADLGLLRLGAQGYEFRNRAIKDAFQHNLRPAARARTRRRIEGDLEREESYEPG